MTIFQHYLWLFGMRFHLWTALVLGGQLLYMLYITRKCGVNSLVVSVISVTLSIHFYETIHGIFDYMARQEVGASLWKFNIPVVVGMVIMLRFYNKVCSVVKPNIRLVVPIFCAHISVMVFLLMTGFFGVFNHGPMWGLSKITLSLFVLSLFIGEASVRPCPDDLRTI